MKHAPKTARISEDCFVTPILQPKIHPNNWTGQMHKSCVGASAVILMSRVVRDRKNLFDIKIKKRDIRCSITEHVYIL